MPMRFEETRPARDVLTTKKAKLGGAPEAAIPGDDVQWAFAVDGVLHTGMGPQPALVELATRATAAAFSQKGTAPVYVAGGVDLIYTVTQFIGSRKKERAWGIKVPEGSRLWLWPHGIVLGVGPSVEAVEQAVRDVNAASRQA